MIEALIAIAVVTISAAAARWRRRRRRSVMESIALTPKRHAELIDLQRRQNDER
jgi:hypothetical protein